MINKRYKIIKKLGEGRSQVFACSDIFSPNEKVVIKILQYTASNSEIEYFDREFEILKRFSHPAIISAYDKGVIHELDEEYKKKYKISKNDRFITLERVEGGTLDSFSDNFTETDLESIITQISLSLYYIHQANYIYFDLKPENILIQRVENHYKIKLIDFGLAKFYPELNSNFVKGTQEYLSPEILKGEEISFNSDLYSFGILLYKLVYNKFPFKNRNRLEIFRAHIEKQFNFPSSKYSNKIVSIIEKMLNKDKDRRYQSSLEVIYSLNKRELHFKEKSNLVNSLKYLERKEINNALHDYYIINNLWGNVAILVGEKGAGKSLLLEKTSYKYQNSVLIHTNSFISSTNFWQQFFHRLLFSKAIYRFLDNSLIQYITRYIADNSENLLVDLKTIISKIALTTDFLLIIDDFDALDQQTIEIFYELFPILLANQIKIIVSTQYSAEIDFPSKIENVKLELKSFSDDEIKKTIENSYNNFIDKNELQNLIISFSATRTPAQIESFISELTALEIINYKNGKVSVTYDESKITQLLSSHDEVFFLLKSKLSARELEILDIISLFENDISINLISFSINSSVERIIEAIQSLRDKSILMPATQNRNLSFSNIGFKKYIYKSINNVSQKHNILGEIILQYFPDADKSLVIRQFELSDNFDKAKAIITQVINDGSLNNFPQTKIKLLKRKLSYSLSDEDEVISLLDLSEVLLKIGKYNELLSTLTRLEKKELSKFYKFQKNKLLGFFYIRTGKLKEGIRILIEIVNYLPESKEDIYIELAGAYVDINDYEKANSLCREVLKHKEMRPGISSRAQNILGISKLHHKHDLEAVLSYFTEANRSFKQENNLNRIAGSEVNLGNIQNMLGNFVSAEKHWNKALQLNQSIGNVEQEANVLLNSGIFYYEHSNFEKAIELYTKAGNIFRGLGNKISYGLVCTNLGESYLEVCEYDKSLSSLKEAEKIFKDLNNINEEMEVHILLSIFYISLKDFSLAHKHIENAKDLEVVNFKRKELILNYVETIYSYFVEKEMEDNEVEELISTLYEDSENLLATHTLFVYVENLISLGKFATAINFLNSKEILNIISFNPKFDAYRYYLLSRIPTTYHDDMTLTENILLSKAFIILQKGAISELIIRVLYNLANFYFMRGNREKATKYATMGDTTVKYIKSQNKLSLMDKFDGLEREFNNILLA